MDQAVILSTARTPIGKAYRGAFNDTDAPTLASFSIKASIEKAGLDPYDYIYDVKKYVEWNKKQKIPYVQID